MSNLEKGKQVCDSRQSSNDIDAPMESEKLILGAKRSRAKSSTIWNDFDEVIINDVKKGRCKYCKTLFVISGGCTSSMKRHKCLHGSVEKKQSTLSFKSGETSDVTKKLMEMGSNTDAQSLREIIAKLVATGEHAFSIVDNCWFRFILRLGFPNWVPVSRITVKKDAINLYANEKKKLKEAFKCVHKIALTTDMWTSNQQLGYMALTTHFINNEWNIQQRIINFTEVEPPHTGLVLANVIAKQLTDWDIKKKVISITVDNASSNDVLVKKLKENMEKSGISLYCGGKFFHVRCCAHILNLMVQDGLSAIKDEIVSIRDAIKYIKVSPSRLHIFAAVARELEISTKKKVLDVPTCWNSTYFMLETALTYKDVFARYNMEDPGLIWLLGPEDWEKIAMICQFLKVFHDVSKLFSGSSYATTNLFFLEIWRVQEILQENVDKVDGFLKTMAMKMKEKFDKYWKSCNLLMIIASILDPRIKVSLSEFVFSRIYKSKEEKEEQMNTIKQSLNELFDTYIQKNELDVNTSVHSIGSSNSQEDDTLADGGMLFFKLLEQADSVAFQSSKSEIDTYLDDGLIKREANGVGTFNILGWWKEKESKYQILSQMARDILSIPITSVASEKAFSTGGRIVNDSRSSLNPTTVEALICLEDWVKNAGDPMQEVLAKVLAFSCNLGVQAVEAYGKSFKSIKRISDGFGQLFGGRGCSMQIDFVKEMPKHASGIAFDVLHFLVPSILHGLFNYYFLGGAANEMGCIAG